MINSKQIGMQMSISTKLDKVEKRNDVNQKLYRGMIGSILFLTISRLDILFAVCLYARFQPYLKKSRLIAVKKILKYFIGTLSLGLWYPKLSYFDLLGYFDTDFTSSRIERKNTSGMC
ncbi:hypothetical protein REPUB_Repub06bG0088900 [Reevesia pubescens]